MRPSPGACGKFKKGLHFKVRVSYPFLKAFFFFAVWGENAAPENVNGGHGVCVASSDLGLNDVVSIRGSFNARKDQLYLYYYSNVMWRKRIN